jgi:hypothetical protein
LDCPLCANSGLMHRSKQHLYSITSSARASTVSGTVRPSALAVPGDHEFNFGRLRHWQV